jgi:hypothetical protein
MRIFARRERPHPGAQLTFFEAGDGWRYAQGNNILTALDTINSLPAPATASLHAAERGLKRRSPAAAPSSAS